MEAAQLQVDGFTSSQKQHKIGECLFRQKSTTLAPYTITENMVKITVNEVIIEREGL